MAWQLGEVIEFYGSTIKRSKTLYIMVNMDSRIPKDQARKTGGKQHKQVIEVDLSRLEAPNVVVEYMN